MCGQDEGGHQHWGASPDMGTREGQQGSGREMRELLESVAPGRNPTEREVTEHQNTEPWTGRLCEGVTVTAPIPPSYGAKVQRQREAGPQDGTRGSEGWTGVLTVTAASQTRVGGGAGRGVAGAAAS